MSEGSIKFGREWESPREKARWRQSLTHEQGVDLFIEHTELILSRATHKDWSGRLGKK